jgi:hypothetical protein
MSTKPALGASRQKAFDLYWQPRLLFNELMQTNDLTPGQLAALKAQVDRQLAYLNRLCERMNRRGFAPFDSVFQASLNARNAVQDLHVAIHYADVKHGVAAEADDCNDARRA